MMNKEKKISFFKRVIISIKDFDRYSELATLNIKTTIFYVIKLMIIISLVVSILFLYDILLLIFLSLNLLSNLSWYVNVKSTFGFIE